MNYCIVILLLISVITLKSGVGFSKNSNSLPGKVVDKKDSSLNINLLLFDVHDTSFIKGDYYSNGQFIIERSINGALLVRRTSMGFGDTLIRIANSTGVVDVGKILLTEAGGLDEVVVKDIYLQSRINS